MGIAGPWTIVAFSFATPHARETGRIVGKLREVCGPAGLFVAGGPHPTGDPEGPIELGFDIVVRGEGEETFPDLLEALGSADNLGSVK